MTATRAVYEGGVFKPVDDVHLRESDVVDLSVVPVPPGTERPDPNAARRWRAMLDAFHAEVLALNGRPYPDSTADIAADRAYGRGL